MLGVTGPLVGRVKNTINDDLGRWTGIEFLGRDGRCLLVLCAYQVCQKSNRQGYLTAYNQQVTMLRLRGIANPKPRQQFIKDLSTLIASYHKLNADIILMGDFNEVIGLDLNGMIKVIQAGELTDAQAFCHGTECEESTYARGPN